MAVADVRHLQASLFPVNTKGSYLSSFLQNTLRSNQVEINTDNRTLRPVAKLKEPRDLFQLPKELDCSQQAARWPTECQVLEERVQHIEYMPIVPELCYQPTGREIQPKPVGDEAGTIVFQYYPMSAVNYFSRSSVGGSRFFMPCLADRDDELRFESRFESGNLAKAVRISETYYELSLRTDLYTNRHMQWFYFKIDNTRKRVMYRFSIVNLSKPESLYSVGMKPLLYSTKEALVNRIGWTRCGDNIVYFRNDCEKNGDDDTNGSYTLSFNLEFPHDNDSVYLAHCYPYTYTDLQDYLIKLQNHPVKSTYSTLRLLCRSLAGNNVYYLTVTAPSSPDDPKKKKAVVITGRVHPGETPSSWMMKGFMDFLTGDSTQARELREKFIFKLVPMLNPDGVIVGNNRCSLTGRDLNRQYRTVIRETYPPVWHTKLMVRRLMEECGIAMYCDLHAHSRKHNVFIYGCENKRYIDKRLHEQVFPLMLHKNAADKFSFESCKFRIQRSKEGTGRVVVWMMGVANSYTMEASFGGSTLGGRNDTHFTTQDYEGIGRSFCETLLDFSDENPSKVILKLTFFAELQERLRTKIINRLMKEGSSADEPTNIDLSDYSSDEGDTSSCSDEEPPPDDECCSCLPVPPPSPILPHHKDRSKNVKGASSKTIRTAVATSPPIHRKTLQVHHAKLDLLEGSELLDITTELESGEESSSCQNQTRRSRSREIGSKGSKGQDKAEMPPELIVTPVQVFDGTSFTDPGERSTSKDSKGRLEDSPTLPRRGDNSWSPERARATQLTKAAVFRYSSDVIQDGMNINMQSCFNFRQTFWTGVDSCSQCEPLSWGLPLPNNEALLRSCSKKLSALKKNKHSRVRGKGSRNTEIELEEAKDEKEAPTPRSVSKKKYKLKNKMKKLAVENPQSSNNMDENKDILTPMQIEQTKLEEKLSKESTRKLGKRSGKQSGARSRFRKGGIVAAATIQTSVEQEAVSDEDQDGKQRSGKKKKKKKRKIHNVHHSVRQIVNSVTATSENSEPTSK